MKRGKITMMPSPLDRYIELNHVGERREKIFEDPSSDTLSPIIKKREINLLKMVMQYKFSSELVMESAFDAKTVKGLVTSRFNDQVREISEAGFDVFIYPGNLTREEYMGEYCFRFIYFVDEEQIYPIIFKKGTTDSALLEAKNTALNFINKEIDTLYEQAVRRFRN